MSKLTYNLTTYELPKIGRLRYAIIESIGDYLNSLTYPKAEYDGIQPLSIAQNLTIRVAAAESLASQASAPTYADLRPCEDGAETGKHFYYFVEKITRLANKTIQFDLSMDSLNTFSSIIKNGLTSRTMVKREQRDRFYQPASLSYPIAASFIKKIDKVGEGFSPLKLKTSDNEVKAPRPLLDLDWYLIYKSKYDTDSTETNNPVSCFLCASEALTIAKGSTGSVITLSLSDLQDGKYYYVTSMSAPGFELTFKNSQGGTDVEKEGDSFVPTPVYICKKSMIVFWKESGALKFWMFGGQESDPNTLLGMAGDDGYTSIKLTKCYSVRVLTYKSSQFAQINTGDLIVYNSGVSGNLVVNQFSIVDKSDSKLVKIIRLPYPPCAVSYDDANNIYVFPGEWSFNTNGLMQLSDNSLGTEFSYSLPDRQVSECSSFLSLASYNVARTIEDPKLLHSDFYTLKYSYDTFAMDFKLENLLPVAEHPSDAPYLTMSFKPTNTINSNFLFMIEPDEDIYLSGDDYHVLLSSRNNEVTIFNNAYLNYIKNGYNYDKKNKAVESAGRWTGVVLSGAGAVVSAVAGGPIGALGAVSLGISAAIQAANAINSQITSDNNQAAKLQELRAQSTSVAGVDDIDLLKAYTDNRLHEIRYEVNDVTKSMLNDYFYYFGYATNRQKIPNTNNRIWFDYVQCTPYFTDGAYSALAPYLADIADKMETGITIFHKVVIGSNIEWDLDQTHENLERWFIK